MPEQGEAGGGLFNRVSSLVSSRFSERARTQRDITSKSLNNFDGVKARFEAENQTLDYGTILSMVSLSYKDRFPVEPWELIERRLAGEPDIDWEFVTTTATTIAKRKGLSVPAYASKKFSELATGYSTQKVLIEDLERMSAQHTSEKTIDIYRGTNNPDAIQLAGGLRTMRFTLDELDTLPVSLVAYINGDSMGQVNSLRKRETQYAQDKVRADLLGQSGMEHSLWLSTTTNNIFAERIALTLYMLRYL